MDNKICSPYQNCKQTDITQYFGVNKCSYQLDGHTGLDFAFPNCYGKVLVAVKRSLVKQQLELW